METKHNLKVISIEKRKRYLWDEMSRSLKYLGIVLELCNKKSLIIRLFYYEKWDLKLAMCLHLTTHFLMILNVI